MGTNGNSSSRRTSTESIISSVGGSFSSINPSHRKNNNVFSSLASPWTSGGKRLEPPHGPVYYNTKNKVRIITQCYGSAWPRVLPYCIINTLFMLTLSILKRNGYIDGGITSVGHNFAGMVVSFLLVSRINSSLGRYDKCRTYIENMYRETRDIIQNMTCMTRALNNHDRVAKEWRSEMAYRTLVMLRTAVALVRYNYEKKPTWEVPELTGMELDYASPKTEWRRHAQIEQTNRADSMRVPIRLAYLLRETICSQSSKLQNPLCVPKEMKLLSSVDSFLGGYYGIRQFITTPVPFPLIQMTRTIVMFYIFTVPFVLLDDGGSEKLDILEHCIIIFLLTYGFMGLEEVSIELDDPFGDDDNDFDVLAYARICFEDIYMLIHDTDGQEWADALRDRMHERSQDPSKISEAITISEDSRLLSRV